MIHVYHFFRVQNPPFVPHCDLLPSRSSAPLSFPCKGLSWHSFSCVSVVPGKPLGHSYPWDNSVCPHDYLTNVCSPYSALSAAGGWVCVFLFLILFVAPKVSFVWRVGHAKRENIHEELIIGDGGNTTSEGRNGGNGMRRIKNTGKSLGFFFFKSWRA